MLELLLKSAVEAIPISGNACDRQSGSRLSCASKENLPGNPTNQPIGCSAQLPGRNPWQHFCNRGKAAFPPALLTCFTVITDLLTIWRSFSRTVRSFLGGGSWNVHRFQRHRFSEPNKVYRCEYLRRCRFS